MCLVADPYTGVRVYDVGYGGWVVVGGTSASTPQWAGLIAISYQLVGSFPVAERCAREFLSLPMYPELQTSEIELVVDVLKKCLRD